MITQIIGYRCIADCQLDYTNFQDGDEIIISNNCQDHDWKGTDFFDRHPYEFEKIYSDQTFTVTQDDKTIHVIGDEQEAQEKYNKSNGKWDSFYEWCEMELTHIYPIEY